MKTTHECAEENAHKFADWILNRGGVLSWSSHDLGNPGHSVSTPALTKEGEPYPKPDWRFVTPDIHCTKLEDCQVYVPKVVQRMEIKLKEAQGKLVLTDASNRKVKQALARAGKDSFYRFGATGTSEGSTPHGLMFGCDTIEICVDGSREPLSEWLKRNPLPVKEAA